MKRPLSILGFSLFLDVTLVSAAERPNILFCISDEQS